MSAAFRKRWDSLFSYSSLSITTLKQKKVVGSYLFIYLGLLTPRAKPEVNGQLPIEEVASSALDTDNICSPCAIIVKYIELVITAFSTFLFMFLS